MNTLDFLSIGSPRFLAFMPLILKWECDWPNRKDGDYSNDPDDPGGETRFGIDKNSSPKEDIFHLTLDRAVTIYYSQYWVPGRCEAMANGMGEVFMNASVNCGIKRAAYWAWGEKVTPSLFLDHQETYYRTLADEHVHLQKFLKGWLNRTADLRTWLVDHVPSQSASSPHQSAA